MFKDINALREERQTVIDRGQAIVDLAKEANRELTTEEQSEIDSQDTVLAKIDSDMQRLEKIEARQKDIAKNRGKELIDQTRSAGINVPRSEWRYTPKNFLGPTAREDAYIAGMFCKAVVFKDEKSRQWLDSNCVDVQNALVTYDNSLGGYLVPEQLENAIIRNVEQYGVFRRNVGMQKTLVGGTWSGPRRLSGITVSYPGETVAGTESTPTVGLVQLKANDAVAWTKVSRNLDQDAISALGDMLVQEFALAYAIAEDSAGFIGDGTNTYGGMVGLKNALLAGCDVTATGDTTFADLERASFESMVGALPDWPGVQPKWYISKPGYYASMARLQMAAGGNAVADLGNGPVLQYMGYPVEFTSVLPKALTSLTGQRVAYFGDLSYAAAMGTARGMAIESDMSKYFHERMIAVQAFSRYDIEVYEVGTANEAGGMIALKMG